MATENLKELLKEGVTLDEQNVGQLTEMFEQAIVAERIKLTESKDAEIAALNEQHAKALEDATVMANARIDEAIDVAVDKFIADRLARQANARAPASRQAKGRLRVRGGGGHGGIPSVGGALSIGVVAYVQGAGKRNCWERVQSGHPPSGGRLLPRGFGEIGLWP